MSTNNFEAKMKELEEIVAWFDSADVNLDQALEKFERGTKLAKELKANISDVENKVRKLQGQQ